MNPNVAIFVMIGCCIGSLLMGLIFGYLIWGFKASDLKDELEEEQRLAKIERDKQIAEVEQLKRLKLEAETTISNQVEKMKDMETENKKYEKELSEAKSQLFVYEKLSQQHQK
ncbi:seryl-tRNA synthetase [Bacillus cereus group sp. BfR-BA-01363]|uniref:seryl-tRNA synthetase n=1 Tax=Bacillus cereus group sp. BfR-BA-01363 TaxID=3094882 RepID=UPI0029C4762C|nr:seryl-tRNA synthetase [Bacillus cereus group sp. BfR-BA-01363]MDX5853728.1 seryl-tRNA synthetase [Bacillus cereus group sp. BfR-BA-01363]